MHDSRLDLLDLRTFDGVTKKFIIGGKSCRAFIRPY
jgi:hypothetical protein